MSGPRQGAHCPGKTRTEETAISLTQSGDTNADCLRKKMVSWFLPQCWAIAASPVLVCWNLCRHFQSACVKERSKQKAYIRTVTFSGAGTVIQVFWTKLSF